MTGTAIPPTMNLKEAAETLKIHPHSMEKIIRAGVTFAITNKRWMSAFSGCFDVSLSRITSSAQTLNEDNSINVFKHSGTMLSGKLGIRYTYPKGMIRPFAELGIDISSILNGTEKQYERSEKWMDGIFPGYYANAGINVKLSRKNKQMICIRVQFKSLRDVVEKCSFLDGWSSVIGYTF